MKEITGDIWDYHKKGHWIVITTNGTVRSNGEVVMGRGFALQAKQRYPELPKVLGSMILELGNCLFHWGERGLVFFSVKYNWWEKASLELIEKSAKELRDFFDNVVADYPTPVYLLRVGCGNGRLNWRDVKPTLEKYLDDRFVVVERKTR